MEQAELQAIPLRVCPFCAGEAEVFHRPQTARYGVNCSHCRCAFLPVFSTDIEAILHWNRRTGTSSAAGGRATRGKCSRRKLRAAKRNLRRARERKQIRIIRSRVEVLAQRLKEARSIEFNEIVREAAQARRRFALQRVAIETGTTLHAVNERHQPTAM